MFWTKFLTITKSCYLVNLSFENVVSSFKHFQSNRKTITPICFVTEHNIVSHSQNGYATARARFKSRVIWFEIIHIERVVCYGLGLGLR